MIGGRGKAWPAYFAPLWELVAAHGRPATTADVREILGVRELVVAHRFLLGAALTRLVRASYLRSDGAGRFQAVYWYAPACFVPTGAMRPALSGAEAPYALARSFVNVVGATDRTPLFSPVNLDAPEYDFLKCPSRHGNRLVFRDGRVTDLEGRAL